MVNFSTEIYKNFALNKNFDNHSNVMLNKSINILTHLDMFCKLIEALKSIKITCIIKYFVEA